jgi:citrate synthase
VSTLGVDDPILAIAKKLEESALVDILFQENYIKRRFLFWNYLQSFRIPTDMFTVMFAIGRLPGWIAQWKEMRENKEPIEDQTDLYWTPFEGF